MEWLYYLLEANLYLLLFYGFYRLLLQHQTFYSNNRYYLLTSSITSFLIPLMQLGFLRTAPIVDNALFPPPILYTEEQLVQMQLAALQEPINYTTYLYAFYLLIAIGFALKLSFNVFKIVRIWLKAKKTNKGKITLIELEGQSTAFSFFNLLFIHPSLANKPIVLKHEMVHIKQKHSFDILFFEIIQIICWFNPIIYLIKNDIKLLHEYIADQESADLETDKHTYAMFLIENSFGSPTTPLANQFSNQSILKRRINMLNKKKSVGWTRFRLLLVLPLAVAMLCTSTLSFSKSYGYFDLLPEKSKITESIEQEANSVEKVKTSTKNQVKFPPPVVKKDQVKFPPPVVRKNMTFFATRDFKISSTHPPYVDKRYILFNGKHVSDTSFWGVFNATSIKHINASEAISKYGEIAGNGAVEITGGNINFINPGNVVPPPPIESPPPGYKSQKDQVKFPPPIVKPNGKNLKTPPAVEPRPPRYQSKKDQVKFPPPIVKPKAKSSETAPAVEPPSTTNEELAVLNKVQSFLEEKLKEGKNDMERKLIQNQKDFVQQNMKAKN